MPQIGACCNSMRNPVKLFVFEGLAGFPPFFSRDAASTASARHGDIRCKSVIITGTDRILGGVTADGFNCRGLLSKQDLSRLSVKLVQVQCHPSATTMTWSDDHDGDVMIWTRPGGTADDPAGTWERTDEEGNTHTLQVAVADSASGTVSSQGRRVVPNRP